MKGNARMETVDWIVDLFEKIEEPTYVDRIIAVGLLLAEVDSWDKDPTISSDNSSPQRDTL